MNSTPNGTKSDTVGTSVIHELEVVSGHWAKAKPTNKKIIAQFNFIVHLPVLLFPLKQINILIFGLQQNFWHCFKGVIIYIPKII